MVAVSIESQIEDKDAWMAEILASRSEIVAEPLDSRCKRNNVTSILYMQRFISI